MADGPGGIFVKSDDGALYFIRDELLEACKVDGEDLERWGPVVDGEEPDVEGFSLNFGIQPQNTAIRVQSPQLNPFNVNPAVLDLSNKQYSTVMCPW